MADYSQLVLGQGGTVYNTAANVAYSNPYQLAQDLGISANQIQWGNIKNDPTFTGFSSPNVSQPVSTGQISNNGSLNFSPAAPTDNGSSLVSGIIAGQNYSLPPQQSSTPALDKATADYNTSADTYKNLIANTPDEYTMFTNIENQAGLPGQKSQIDQLKTELANLTAGYNNQYQDIATKGISSGTPAVFYQGEQAAQQRQASVVIAGKSAVLAALQGNYNEAESLAKQAADMQFKAAQDKITNAYNFLKLNQDTLTKAQADAIKTNTAQQSIQVAAQKENVKIALSSGVQTQFWTKPNGTVVRTNDGYEFHTPEEAFAAGVLPDFSNAPKINPVGKSETKKINGVDYHIVYDQSGNILSKTALNGSGGGGGWGSSGSYTVSSATQEIKDQWNQGYIQGNGKISSSDYKTAKAWWTQQKDSKGNYLSAASFDQQFANLIDQSSKTWKTDYGYKGN